VSLRWLVHPGTVTESLLTGMLGLRPAPTQIEAFVYLAYAIPMALFVLWPRGRRAARRTGTEQRATAAQTPA
jgi:high-affinity iron transporter